MNLNDDDCDDVELGLGVEGKEGVEGWKEWRSEWVDDWVNEMNWWMNSGIGYWKRIEN